MAEINRDTDALVARVAELERIVAALATAPGLENSSQKGGTHVILSPNDGLPMQLFGSFSDGVTSFYGSVLYDGNGNSMLMTRDDKPGLIKPDIHLPMYAFQPLAAGGEYMAITSAGFVRCWAGGFRRAYHDVFRIALQVGSDVGTTGEIKLIESQSGAACTVLTTTPNTAQLVTYDWLHTRGVGDDGLGSSGRFDIQVRRIGGAGNINVYPPQYSHFTSSALVPAADVNGHAVIA